MLGEDSVKPGVLFMTESIPLKVLIMMISDIKQDNVNLDSVICPHHVILVEASLFVQTSLCIFRFSNKVQVNLSLPVLHPKLMIGIIRPIVMIIPYPNHPGFTRLKHSLVI
jgi:hypothetical protein